MYTDVCEGCVDSVYRVCEHVCVGGGYDGIREEGEVGKGIH